MANRLFSIHRLFLLSLALAVFFACHLTKNEDVEDSFSFPALKDSIVGADQALIVLKAESGQVIDTLFNGPVTASTTFKGLQAPHFNGGKVTIEIQATQNGKIVYQITRSYDGDKDETLGTVVLVSPSASVQIQWATPKLREGDSVPLPPTKVLPATLADPSLAWASRQGTLLLAGDSYLKALRPGSATLIVWLRSNPLKRDSVVVEIVSKNAPVKALDSLRLTPDPLTLALRGPAGRFSVNPYPVSASKEVTWTSLDAGIVTVSDVGLLSPLSIGVGRILAISKLEPTALDTALVEVIAAVKVDSIRFEKDSVEVFIQGSPDSIRVQTYPALANPSVNFSVRDASVAQVEGGKVKGLIEGETLVLARSVEDSAQVDSLRVIVFPSEKVDSVRLAQDSLKLYVKGESQSLMASIFPSTLQKRFLWRSAAAAIATVDAAGVVTPVSEGKAYVSVTARADGQKRDSALVIVKKDTPRLIVGNDTVLAVGASLTHSPVVTQEYGLILMFKWDLNGDGTYEDSSTTVRPNLAYLYNEAKDYGVRFYVRDTEGNDTVVIRRVKAVNGRVVQILSPKDGSFTNQSPITVTWMVDGTQTANSQALNLGANTIVRSAQDSAKNTYSASITVTLDQTAPNRPMVNGSPVPVNTLTPAWAWTSGGGGGNGTYRYRLDNPDMAAATATVDTFYTASTNQNAGTHTLYVQERDEAENWSPNGSFAIRIDTTAPPAPTLTVAPNLPTNNTKPTWNWTGGVGDAYRYYRYKLGDDDFRSGGKDTTGTSFNPTTGFTEGTYTLYVQERDSAGNWSASASMPVTIDLDAPTAPVVSVVATLTNDETPTWTWTAGMGGNGSFRYKINNADLTTGAIATTVLTYTPTAGLGEGPFSLYVQERDAAGNWSSSGSKVVRIDLTAPAAPRIDSTPYSPLNSLRSKWTWRSGTGGAKVFRARVDNPDLNGASEQTDSSFTSAVDQSEGRHTLFVQERDSAGNWSQSSTRMLVAVKKGVVGTEGFSTSEAYSLSLGFGAAQQPTLAFVDQIDGIVVRRFNGTGWEPLGIHPITPNSGRDTKLAFAQNGTAYLAYWEDNYPAQGITVRRLNGSKWDTLGNRCEAAITTQEYSLAINGNNEPMVAYTFWDYDKDQAGIVVNKFSGTAWSPSGQLVSDTAGSPPSIAVDANNTPFVAYGDNRNNGRLTIKYLSGTNWVPVGSAGISKGLAGYPVLKFSKQGVLHAVFSEDVGGQRRVSVMTFEGGKWAYINEGGIPVKEILGLDLAIDEWERPVVAVRESDVNTLPRAFVFSNSQWRSVGQINSSVSVITSLTLGLDPNGVPFLGFADFGANGKRAIVYKVGMDP